MIEGYLGDQLKKIATENNLKGLSPEVFIQRIAYYMGEINAAHPFREGNGRVQRIFCAQLAEQAGYFIGFEDVSQETMYSAMIASFHGDQSKLLALLNEIVAVIEL
jgi:cell filamentation protein